MKKDIFYIPRVKAPDGLSESVMARIKGMEEPAHAELPQRRWIAPYLPFAMAAMLLLAYGLGVATSLLLSSRSEQARIMVRFSLYAPNAEKVSLAGDFNGWSREGNPLLPRGDGVWSVTIPLASGRYEYMFLVDGKTWLPDPGAGRYTNDGFGGKNSILDLV